MMLLLKNFFPSRTVFGWAMYDWANSAVATIFITAMFPIFFRDQALGPLSESGVTLSLGIANSATSISILVAAPLLAIYADLRGWKREMLITCLVLGAICIILLVFVRNFHWLLTCLLYFVATSFWLLANVFYDALLVDICKPSQYQKVSAAGYALGYLGGGIALAVAVALISAAQMFSLLSAGEMVVVCFIFAVFWWVLFSLPLVLWLRVSPRGKAVVNVKQQFLRTIQLLRDNPRVAWFLLAFFLYMDGVDTVVRMGVNYGQSIGIGEQHLLGALLTVQFIAFPATLLYASLANVFGCKKMITAAIIAYIGISIIGSTLSSTEEFYFLIVLIGLFQGGIQSQSRAFFASIIPAESSTQFFSLFNILGKFSVLVGPLIFGLVSYASDSTRLGLLSITVLLVGGMLVLMRKVPATN